MIFLYLILSDSRVLSARWIYFKIEACCFEVTFLCPLNLFCKSKVRELHETIRFVVTQEGVLSGEVARISNALFKSSISIAGLCFTFSFPSPSSIWFDLLSLGLVESFRPLLSGRAFKYLSMACRKQKSVYIL